MGYRFQLPELCEIEGENFGLRAEERDVNVGGVEDPLISGISFERYARKKEAPMLQ